MRSVGHAAAAPDRRLPVPGARPAGPLLPPRLLVAAGHRALAQRVGRSGATPRLLRNDRVVHGLVAPVEHKHLVVELKVADALALHVRNSQLAHVTSTPS